MAKLILRVPTLGKQAGDEIEVSDAATAEELVRNGAARRKSTASQSTKKD